MTSAELKKQLDILNAQRDTVKLKWDGFYTDTVFNYPDQFHTDTTLSKKAYQYVDVKGIDKKYKGRNVECLICYDKKSVKTGRWCRVCNFYCCAGCYKSCRQQSSYEPITVIDCHYKPYEQWDKRAEQPRCPQCRGEGTFGTQGVNATRVAKIAVVQHPANPTRYQYFGPDVTEDVELQSLTRDYLNEYNKVTDYLNEQMAVERVLITNSISFIENSDEYNGFCDDINEKEAEIKVLNDKILNIQMGIYNLHRQRELFVKDKAYFAEEIELPSDIGKGHRTPDTRTSYRYGQYLRSNYPRRFFNISLNSGGFRECDIDIASKCDFSRLNRGDKKAGGYFKTLDDKLLKVREKYDYLLTGAVNPNVAVSPNEMPDDELALMIKKLQDEQKKRGASGI